MVVSYIHLFSELHHVSIVNLFGLTFWPMFNLLTPDPAFDSLNLLYRLCQSRHLPAFILVCQLSSSRRSFPTDLWTMSHPKVFGIFNFLINKTVTVCEYFTAILWCCLVRHETIDIQFYLKYDILLQKCANNA